MLSFSQTVEIPSDVLLEITVTQYSHSALQPAGFCSAFLMYFDWLVRLLRWQVNEM